MLPQLLLDIDQQGPSILIFLFPLGNREVDRKLVNSAKDASANLLVCRTSWPEVPWCPTGHSWYVSKRRGAKLFAFGHQKARPGSQILKKLVELAV